MLNGPRQAKKMCLIRLKVVQKHAAWTFDDSGGLNEFFLMFLFTKSCLVFFFKMANYEKVHPYLQLHQRKSTNFVYFCFLVFTFIYSLFFTFVIPFCPCLPIFVFLCLISTVALRCKSTQQITSKSSITF